MPWLLFGFVFYFALVLRGQATLRQAGEAVSGKEWFPKEFRSSLNAIPDFNLRRDRAVLPLRNCSFWAVTTTIFPPSQAIRIIENNFKSWCLVVVGDKSGPSPIFFQSWESSSRCIFLSWEKQSELPFRIIQKLPWKSFGRKNVGYLYAIHSGAKYIWDFDDDNEMLSQERDFPSLIQNTNVFEIQPVELHNGVNPYPLFGCTGCWPRGYPLTEIDSEVPIVKKRAVDGNGNVAVVQFLQLRDPDVDAIFRLTREISNIRWGHLKGLYAVPLGSFCPFNAQSTLFHREGFWGLFLPVTVNGRVSDIWRSYLMQRIMLNYDQRVAFASPIVLHNRTDHSYLADFESEIPLYLKSSNFLTGLKELSLPGVSIASDYMAVLDYSYRIGIIEQQDVFLGKLWLEDLHAAGIRHVISNTYAGQQPAKLDAMFSVRPPHLFLVESWEPFASGIGAAFQLAALSVQMNGSIVVPNAIDGILCGYVTNVTRCARPRPTHRQGLQRLHSVQEYFDFKQSVESIGGTVVSLDTFASRTNQVIDCAIMIRYQSGYQSNWFCGDQSSGPRNIVLCPGVAREPAAQALALEGWHIVRFYEVSHYAQNFESLQCDSIAFLNWRGASSGASVRSHVKLHVAAPDTAHIILHEDLQNEVSTFISSISSKAGRYSVVKLRLGKIGQLPLVREQFQSIARCILQEVQKSLPREQPIVLISDLGIAPEYFSNFDANEMKKEFEKNLSSIVYQPSNSYMAEKLVSDGAGGFRAFIELELSAQATNLYMFGCSNYHGVISRRRQLSNYLPTPAVSSLQCPSHKINVLEWLRSC